MDRKVEKLSQALILNSGRCGSTLISEILNMHPRILSISEFFRTLGPTGYEHGSPSGKVMWKKLSKPTPVTQSFLAKASNIKEILYPLGAPESRFTAKNLPPIMAMTLPHITSSFESIYDELKPVISDQPRQSMSEHYYHLFEYLCARFERDVWVERSGGSLIFGAKLLHMFPRARVIHLVRDGRDTALSMSQHQGFKLLVGAYRALKSRGFDLSSRYLRPTSPRAFTALINILYSFKFFSNSVDGQRLDLEDFGEFWSTLEVTSQQYLSSLPKDQLLRIRYEDIVDEPREQLSRMAEFIHPSLVDEAWLDRAASVPSRLPPRYLRLGASEQRRLTAACSPGLEALGYTTSA